MKKHYLALGAAILVAGAITFGSCEKQAKDLSADNLGTPGAAKNNPTELQGALYQFWMKCDSAYASDSIYFGDVCNRDDYRDFWNMTGINTALVNTIDSLTREELGNYMSTHPDSVLNENYICLPCMNGSLSLICESTRSIHYYMNMMHLSATDEILPHCFGIDYDNPRLRNCLKRCETYLFYTTEQRYICEESCYLTFAGAIMQEMAITYESPIE